MDKTVAEPSAGIENRSFTFADVIYILRKYLLIEIAVFITAVLIGTAVCYFNVDNYIASSSFIIKADINNTNIDYNDTVFSKMYVSSVCGFVKSPAVASKATQICGKKVYQSMIDTSSEEDQLIVAITYTDPDPETAKNALASVIVAAQQLLSEKDDEGNKYFQANINIVVLSESPSVGKASNDAGIMTLAALCGVIVAFLVSFLIYFIGDKVVSVSQLEQITGVRNYACVEKRPDKQLELRDGKPVPITERLVKEYSDGKISDLKKISDAIIYMSSGKKCCSFQFQSALSGEGKSTITASVATLLALNGKKTLVVDCDFCRPSIHRYFGLDTERGITDYLKSKIDLSDIIKTTPNGPDVITCGERVYNHTVIFTSERFADMIEKAKEQYDFILFDSMPVGADSDYINISRFVDSTFLVVGNGVVKSVVLSNAVRDLKICESHVVGTVFNFCPAGNYYYGYYGKRQHKH